MATAKKIPSGNYRCTVYIGKDESGKKKYKTFTDPDKRRCERIASEYVDEHRTVRNTGTFESAIDAYFEAKTAVLSPSTIRGYKCTERYLKLHHSAFCDVKIGNVDREMLQSVVNDMTKRIKPKTIRNHIGFISAVMDYQGYAIPKITLPEKKKPELHIPDTKDVKRIIEHVEGTEMEIPVLLAAFAPLRRSEICGLTLDDIDGDTIHVRQAVVITDDFETVVKGTKTYESDRYILMQHDIVQKIMDKGYVTDIKNPNIITSRFEKIVKDLDMTGMRFHDLRHWCASYLHAQGVPDEYILARGGWKTDHVLKSVYRHELASEHDRWNKQINSGFSAIMK